MILSKYHGQITIDILHSASAKHIDKSSRCVYSLGEPGLFFYKLNTNTNR